MERSTLNPTSQQGADGKQPGTGLPVVSIVIIHWVNIEDTLECLRSLRMVDYPNLNVILVNNGASDFSEPRVRHVFPDVQIITSNENLGFAGGNNLGIRQALDGGADLIMLLNNDTVVHPQLIRALLPAFDDARIGIAGPVISYYDAPGDVWFAGGTYNRWLGYSYRARVAGVDKLQEVDFINGCALLARREVFEAVGLLDEDLFVYFEETDWCLRAARAQFRCMLVRESLVRHKVSASSGVRGTDYLTPTKAYYFGRNPFLILRRNPSWLLRLSGFLSQFAVVLPFWTYQSFKGRNLGVMRDYLVGMWDGMRGRTGKKN